MQLAGSLGLAGAILAHGWLEASMLRHMIVQLPLLVASGALIGWRVRWLDAVRVIDAHGLTGLTALLFISAYWMIPRALEQSLDAALPQMAKFLSLTMIGALLPGALRRANTIVQIFFLGNFCAMTAIVGMLYQDQPRQLCNAYLVDDQALTGMLLVMASVALAVLWCIRQFPQTELAAASGERLPGTAEPLTNACE